MMPDDNNRMLLLIDGSSLLSTQYFGSLPMEVLTAKTDEERERYYNKIMHSSKGVYTNAVYGFWRTLLKILDTQHPSHIAVAWDLSRDTFRRRLYPEYKGNRSDTQLPLKEQFSTAQEMLKRAGVRQFMSREYEADDYCGTLSKLFEREIPVRIMTKDNDYLQLVSDRTNLWMIHSTAKKTDELYKKYHLAKDDSVPERCFPLNPERVKAEFGVEPASIADLKALQGDSSDNIKGVPGVGPAGAVALIAHYGSIEALYDAMEGLDETALKKLASDWKEIGITRSPISKLLKTDDNELVGKEAAFLSKKLATIKRDIDLGDLKLDDLKTGLDAEELRKCFDELDIKSLEVHSETTPQTEASIEYEIIEDIGTLENFVSSVLSDRGMEPDLKEIDVGVCVVHENREIFAVAFTCQRGSFLVKQGGFITKACLEDILVRFDDAGVYLCFFDIKSQTGAMSFNGLVNAFDVSLAAYLMDPLTGSYMCREVSRRYSEHGVDGINESAGRSSVADFWSHDENNAALAAVKESAAAVRCKPVLRKALADTGMEDLYYHIELPLVYVLRGMELSGITLQKDKLVEFGRSLESDISRLQEEVTQRAGEEFNINSPKQLGVILFEKLRLPGGKKTKTGYSTGADVLEKLRIEDPIIEKILEYRKLTKLKSTYADALSEVICEDGRIRTTFNQMVTATGRLSSASPNLQNIPVRTAAGRRIRELFVASPGCVFIDADYSQIELRILAAMSGDEKLIAAYRNSEDIHRSTASAVFHVPYDEVTQELRRKAKAVNFGIVYGISSFGLGEDLGISRKEASEYIEAYFETYPGIKAYLDGLVSFAKENGYALTAFGRRRPIPELNSSDHMQRQFGERVAMNSPIQGTAADIIKTAMIRTDARLKTECPSARLLLQVHDELLVEVPVEHEETVKRILAEEMTGAADLPVRLEVSIETGVNWNEAH
ncbi:MAG: DNA polymerase I [Lachnospiraceae bacterium]|nr:DNA polymerase I [Lachnospiraceae bacterium]